jgi:hypothetical protein
MEVIRIASKSDATRATLGIQAEMPCRHPGATGSSTQTLHRAPTDHLCEDVRQDPGTLQVFGACDLARAIGQPSPSDADYDTITTSGTGARLIQHGWWAGQPVPPTAKGTIIRVDVEHPPKPTVWTKKTLQLRWSDIKVSPTWNGVGPNLGRLDIKHNSGRQVHPLVDPAVVVQTRAGGPLDRASPPIPSYGLPAVGR